MHNFRELKIWVRSMDLVTELYKATSSFPSEEKFGLISQIRRSAVSIPSNISEGAGRNSDREFLHFLSISHASSYELQTQLMIAERLHMIDPSICEKLVGEIIEIQKMNFRFQESLNKIKSN